MWTLFTVAAPLLLALPQAEEASARDTLDWPQFRGPGGLGLARDDARYPSSLDDDTRVWKAALEPGHSSPCLVGGRLFLTGARERELTTVALERDTGRVVWRRSVEVPELEKLHRINGPASATPASDGRVLVVSFGSYGLLAYDLDGEELWRAQLPVPANTFGTASSPLLARGRLYVLRDTNDESWLEARDPASGEVLWRKEREGFQSGWSTPFLWELPDAPALVTYGARWVTAYDPDDGETLWSVPGLTDEPIITPVTGEGLLFLTSYNMKTNTEVLGLPAFSELLAEHDADGDGRLSREEAAKNESVLSRADADGEGDHPLRLFFRFLDADKSGGIDAQEYEKLEAWVDGFSHANALLAVRPGTAERPAEVAWQHARGVPECPSPLYHDGRVYIVKNGGMLTCLRARTGEVLYTGRIGARGPLYASPVAADGKVYVATARGELAVLRAGDTLEVLSVTDLGERIMATPALAGGRVYVRTEEHVHCFGIPADTK